LTIDFAGILGDAASATGTPIGVAGYVLTEIAEGASNVKAGYDYTQNGDPNGLLGILANKALDVKFLRLTPWIGFVFDVADIGTSIAPAISVVEVQTP
jgi:hypothetical protein